MAHPLVPLLILVIFLLVGALVGYVILTIANDIAEKTSKKMEKHHVAFTKDGMRVGIKEVKDEDYKSKTQSVLVKAWNLSTWPAYKSRLWNKEPKPDHDHPQAQASGASRH